MNVKIFVDFWNLQLSWNEYHRKLGATSPVRIPWEKTLPQLLVSRVDKAATYAGTHVYASINPRSPNDRKLHSFLQTMDLFPGYKVIVKERKPAKPIRGNQIIHAGFKNQGFVVKKACWDHINFEDIMTELLAPIP